MILTEFRRRVYDTVRLIPAGKVATYGQIAYLAGYPNAARAVGNALHRNPWPEEVPCFRVVSGEGKLSGAFAFGGPGVQAERLREDGTEVTGGAVDLSRFGWNAEYDSSPLLASSHGFSTRLGGVSRGDFESLNLGLFRGDDPAAVRTNWSYFLKLIGIPGDRLVYGGQVHGKTVRIVGAGDLRTLYDGKEALPADGYVTKEAGVPLVIFTADCVPLLLEDPEAGVVGAVHCGWRGAALDIMGEAVRQMAALGADSARIRAVTGPSIGPRAFETDSDVPQALAAMLGCGPEEVCVPEEGRPGKYLTDLAGAVRRRLRQLGLAEEHIGSAGGCTFSEAGRYFSHRRSGNARGSQASVIMRKHP